MIRAEGGGVAMNLDSEQIVTVVIAIFGLIFVIWLLKRILSGIRPMSKQEANQHKINKISEEPTYSSSREKKGCGWWLMFFIIVVAIAIALLLAFRTGNLDFHP